jgi:hypothetical protein
LLKPFNIRNIEESWASPSLCGEHEISYSVPSSGYDPGIKIPRVEIVAVKCKKINMKAILWVSDHGIIILWMSSVV